MDLDIPSDSETSFCGSDDQSDSEDKIIVGPLDQNEIHNFQQSLNIELLENDELFAVEDELIAQPIFQPICSFQINDFYNENSSQSISKNKEQKLSKITRYFEGI